MQVAPSAAEGLCRLVRAFYGAPGLPLCGSQGLHVIVSIS